MENQAEFKKFYYETQILERHLDAFGHVNNAVYFELYEEARWDFITRSGHGLERVKADQVGTVVISIECHFKREIKNRDVIVIESQVVSLRSKLMVIEQVIRKKNDDTICNTARFTLGYMDLNKRCLVPFPSDWKAAVGG